MTLPLVDLLIIVAFFAITFFVGIRDRKAMTLEHYWANGRDTGTFVLTATMLSTFVGAGSLVGLANVAYKGGAAALIIASSYVFYFVMFSIFVAGKVKRVGDRLGAYTIPDVLAVRFGNGTRAAAALVNILMFACFLGAQFVAVGAFVNLLTGADLRYATVFGGLAMVLYTSIGGLRADIRTDVFQFFVMSVLVLVYLPLLIHAGGGLEALKKLPDGFADGTAFMPMPVLIAAFVFLGLTPMASADVWQRAYAGRDERTVRRAMLCTGLLMIPFYLLAAAMGAYGRLMFPGLEDPNLLVSRELKAILPSGLLGLAIAGFFAAIMSSADTMLLILSQTLVRDVYQATFRPDLKAEDIFRISRRTTFALGLAGLAAAVFILSVLNLTIGAISFGVVLLPATLAGFYWPRATAKGAAWSILIGLAAILAALPIIGEQAFIPGVIASLASLIVISLLTEHHPGELTL